MASQLKLTIVGDPTPLRNATKQAEASLRKLSRTTSSVSSSMNRSLGALGLGFGLATLANGLKQATKAASEDRKSQGLLAQALKNTVGATSQAIAGAEQYIKKTQLQTAVLDDDLRPALATAVRATGSLSKGQKLLDVALDVSAGTGKDLTVVTKAIARAQSGQLGGLQKLIPGIKATDDIMGELNRQFKGAATTAANLDPYKRLEVIFNDIQEQVGMQLLPVLEEFSAFLVSPEGQKNLKQIVDLFVAMGRAVADVSKFIIDNIIYIKAAVAALVVLKTGWAITTGVVGLYTSGVIAATTATKLLRVALITTGIGAIVVGLGFLAAGWLEAADAQDEYNDQAPNINYAIPDLYGNIVTDPAILAQRAAETKTAIETATDKIKNALENKIKEIKKTAENFRDSIGLAFGTFGKDENSVFNVDVIINKLKRVVSAAKGFADNIKKLRKAGADESVISEIVGMGPAQGNIVAKGLLGSGKLAEYLTLRKSLYGTGAQVGAEAALGTQNTYEININKAVISAADIIREIKLYEKKTGSKYLVGN